MLFFLSIFFVKILQKCQEDAQVRRIEANQLYQPTNQCCSEVYDTAASHSEHSLTLTGENNNYTSDSQVTDTSACTPGRGCRIQAQRPFRRTNADAMA